MNERLRKHGKTLNLREVEVFRPYSDEFPHALFEGQGCAEDEIDAWLSAETLRVAKRGDEVLGVYAMSRTSVEEFELKGVIVTPFMRKRGLGRWLTGHAIGVAESKGGRHVVLTHNGGSRCFARMGFVAVAEGWRFDLVPE